MEKEFFIWLAILGSGAITYILRTFPIFFARRFLSETTPVTEFLEYMSYAILGGLISLSIIKSHSVAGSDASIVFVEFMPAILALVSVCIATLVIKKTAPTLVTGFAVYLSILYVGSI